MIGSRLAILAALCGAALLLQGVWIPAKAALAQILLERAWQRTRAGETAVVPWSWADTWPIARLEVPGRELRTHVLERVRSIDAEGATGGAGEGAQVGPAAQLRPQITGE